MRDIGLGSTEIGSTCCPGQVSGSGKASSEDAFVSADTSDLAADAVILTSVNLLSGQSGRKKQYRTVFLDRIVGEELSSGAGLGEVESSCRRNTRIDARHVNSCSERKASERERQAEIIIV